MTETRKHTTADDAAYASEVFRRLNTHVGRPAALLMADKFHAVVVQGWRADVDSEAIAAGIVAVAARPVMLPSCETVAADHDREVRAALAGRNLAAAIRSLG